MELYTNQMHKKMVYVRELESTPYFLSKVVTAETVRPEKVTETLPSNVHTEGTVASPPT